MTFGGLFRLLSLLASSLLVNIAFGDFQEDAHGDIDLTKDTQEIRVDCHNLPIIGDGIGGAQLACEERLTLYAELRCFPMKRETVEASCPGWEGLQADVDWERVAELIDARTEIESAKKEELESQASEYKKRMERKDH